MPEDVMLQRLVLVLNQATLRIFRDRLRLHLTIFKEPCGARDQIRSGYWPRLCFDPCVLSPARTFKKKFFFVFWGGATF